jgi:hypothetical protein
MSKEIDHAAYMKKVKGMSEESLRFVIRDAREAIAALPSGPKAGYYADEIHYCAAELAKRNQKK